MVKQYCTACEKLVEIDKRCNCGQEWVTAAGFFLVPSTIGVVVSLCKQEGILISLLILVFVSSITLCCHFSCQGNKNTRLVIDIDESMSDYQNNLLDHLILEERKKMIVFSQESNTDHSKIKKENLIQKNCIDQDQTCKQKDQFSLYQALPPQTYNPSPYTPFKQTVDVHAQNSQIVEQQDTIIKNEKVSNISQKYLQLLNKKKSVHYF